MIYGWSTGLEKDLGPIGYGLGALTGAVTPFCSCTTVPIFSGMIDSNVRLGYAISFLIASPHAESPGADLILCFIRRTDDLGLAAVCLVIAIVGGIILDREQLRKYLIEIFLINEDESFNLQAVNQQYVVFLRSLAPVVVIAAALATWLQSWTPSESLLSVLNHYQNAAIPGAVGIGGAVYADIAMLIPIGQLFLDKGLDIGHTDFAGGPVHFARQTLAITFHDHLRQRLLGQHLGFGFTQSLAAGRGFAIIAGAELLAAEEELEALLIAPDLVWRLGQSHTSASLRSWR